MLQHAHLARVKQLYTNLNTTATILCGAEVQKQMAAALKDPKVQAEPDLRDAANFRELVLGCIETKFCK